MAKDAQGMDLDAVLVPVTGRLAWAPLAAENVIPDADMGKRPITLPVAYQDLGLVKVDGAPQQSRETGERTEFWQAGYYKNAAAILGVSANLAEANPAVQALIDGKQPNSDGVVYVDAALPNTRFLLLLIIAYENGMEEVYNGVAQLSEVEVDQSTRGEVTGKAVSFTWAEDPLFDGAPHKRWGPAKPTAAIGG